ncbi:MAG: hypothetical protein NTU66_05935 [Elusimicrobia bacterium]|nr:hypothetical protein [Elusimicrobiota bacterium]
MEEVKNVQVQNNTYGLTEDDIEEFRQIYLSIYKQELSKEEAFQKASKLMRLFKAVYGQ